MSRIVVEQIAAQHPMFDSLENKTSPGEQEEQWQGRAQRAEKRLAELIENIPAGYATLDRNWVFTFANQQAVQGSRQRPEDFWGKNIWAIWPQLAGTEMERQFRQVMETVYRTAPIGLALFDPVEFRYLRLNDRQAEIIGLPMEEIVGKTATVISPIEGLHTMLQQVASGTPITNNLLEGELPMQPGNHRYWTVNYYPVYGPDGSVRAITAASLEITAQKRIEKALIQSEKLAAVGRLASSISHEINNPLEAVTNLLYLAVNQEPLHEATRRYLETAQGEVARVSHIATQSLRFHRQTMNPTHIDPKKLIDSVLDLYQGRLSNSNIQVVSKYKSTQRIWCFENDIRQVLNNLIANAADAMRQGGRLVLCSRDGTDWKTGRSGVRITVADTGHGMSTDVKKRVFEPFYTTKEMNGTGLGLWISHGIVARHHGSLALRSSQKPGWNGTVFSLFLPDEQNASKPTQ